MISGELVVLFFAMFSIFGKLCDFQTIYAVLDLQLRLRCVIQILDKMFYRNTWVLKILTIFTIQKGIRLVIVYSKLNIKEYK